MDPRFVSSEKEHLFAHLTLEKAPFGICWHNRAGTIVRANREAARLLGYTQEELVGMTVFDHDPVFTRKMLNELWDKLFSEGVVRFESTHRRKDGSFYPAEIVTVLFTFEEQEYSCSFHQDITRRKQAENEIRQLNQELEARVIERTRELELAYREMESFTYSVSHDLRAPLRAIDGFSAALLEDYSDQVDEEGRKYLSYLREGCKDMSALIDGLLSLSRFSRGEINRELVDLSALVQVIAEELRQEHPERQVAVNIAQDVKVDADPRLLKAVMENLLGNAWKYTGKVADPCIEFGVQRREDETIFFVRDNGAGFDMAYAQKLFLPFQRLHKTSEFAGIGIGLATVQRIIHRHGGGIWAKGAIQQGATFYFTLEPYEQYCRTSC